MKHPRTDLALEATEVWHERPGDPGALSGVRTRAGKRFGFGRTTVEILTEEGARQVGKPVGTYETLHLEGFRAGGGETIARAARAVAQCLGEMLPPAPRGDVLVVGLGNRMVTPDALGPRCVDHVLVTRHLRAAEPALFAGLQPVAALAAGVLGTTGMESGELTRAVAALLHPAAVIAVDALAARGAGRLCTTIQIADSGIVPGSGVGNARRALDRESLGVPVVAVGVPTVVEAAALCEELGAAAPEGDPVASLLVTPKDIDALVQDLAKIIGFGIDLALQPGLDVEDIEAYLS